MDVGCVVKSLNTLKDAVTLAAGANVTITPSGNTLTLAAAGAGGSGIWSVNGNNTYYNAGNVGLGTATPTAGIRLEVIGATLMRPGNGNVQVGSPNGELGMSIIPTAGNSRADLRFDGSVLKLLASPGVVPPSSANGIAISTAGNVGIGTATPAFKLDVRSDTSTAIVGRSTMSSGVGVYGESAQFNGVRGVANNVNHGAVVGVHNSAGIGVLGVSSGTGVQGESASAGGYGGYFRNTAGGIGLGVQGTAQVGVLQITGGSDFAENFDVQGATTDDLAAATAEPGMVVSIDPLNPGKLTVSTEAYDRRVAGIISGAGGVNAGMTMSQEGTLAHGQQPVALTGRVYCRVDAGYGSIQPGDLLTTSSTAGHAMKVTDFSRGHGAILGKAMTGLKEGKGLVLVLVSLQ